MLTEKIEIFSIDELREAMPKKAKVGVTKELVDKLNSLALSPEEAQAYKDNIVSYSNVLVEGKFKVSSYLNAVRYVSYLLIGMTKKDAYEKVFPERKAHCLAQGISNDDYKNRIKLYQNSKLVQMIKEQANVPLFILNMEHRQLAVNRLVDVLKDDSVSAKVTVEAADVLLKHLTPPATINNQVNVTINQDSSNIIGELRETMNNIAKMKQAEIIEHGDVSKVANQTYLTHKEEEDE